MAVIIAHHGDSECNIQVEAHVCPECGQHIVYAAVPEWVRVYPPDREWVDFSNHVPPAFLRDFEAARKVIDSSPEASATLGRRCLQRLIREHIGITDKNLDKEIVSVLASNQLPSYLAGDIDAIRNIGNFAARPTKSEETGEIMEVGPGEAAWTLKVLEVRSSSAIAPVGSGSPGSVEPVGADLRAPICGYPPTLYAKTPMNRPRQNVLYSLPPSSLKIR